MSRKKACRNRSKLNPASELPASTATPRIFAGLTFTLTGSIHDATRTVAIGGGTYSKELNDSVTHLIASSTTSRKYKEANGTDVQVVSEKWLVDSVRLGEVQDEALYHPSIPLKQQGRRSTRHEPTSNQPVPEAIDRKRKLEEADDIDQDVRVVKRLTTTSLAIVPFTSNVDYMPGEIESYDSEQDLEDDDDAEDEISGEEEDDGTMYGMSSSLNQGDTDQDNVSEEEEEGVAHDNNTARELLSDDSQITADEESSPNEAGSSDTTSSMDEDDSLGDGSSSDPDLTSVDEASSFNGRADFAQMTKTKLEKHSSLEEDLPKNPGKRGHLAGLNEASKHAEDVSKPPVPNPEDVFDDMVDAVDESSGSQVLDDDVPQKLQLLTPEEEPAAPAFDIEEHFIGLPSTMEVRDWLASPHGQRAERISVLTSEDDNSIDADARRVLVHPFHPKVGRILKPTTWIACATPKPQAEIGSAAANTPIQHVADRSRLSGKKRKFYGVRIGRSPGIYYNWDEVKAQVAGFPGAIHQSFQLATKVEHFVNHNPSQCDLTFACSATCQAAVRLQMATPATPDCKNAAEEEDVDPLDRIEDSDERIAAIILERNLTEEQAEILWAVAEGKNVFFTGAAGTGKSTVIEAIKLYFKGSNKGLELIAPTGIAAINIGGKTIHTYAGMVPKMEELPLLELCKGIAREKRVWKRFRHTDILIIDEISMVESNNLTRLSQMMQAAKSSDNVNAEHLPFGGAQVIISGDFYQLPPVRPFKSCLYCGMLLEGYDKGRELYSCNQHGDFWDLEKWAFQSPVWDACEFATFDLIEVHRQRDPAFTGLLHACRKGEDWTEEQQQLLLEHPHEVEREGATKLLPRRDEVRRINDSHLRQIPHPSQRYDAVDNFDWEDKRHPELEKYMWRVAGPQSPLASLADHRYETELELKLGMLVILTYNLNFDHGLVNGSVGKIVGFTDMKKDRMPCIGTDGPCAFRNQSRAERDDQDIHDNDYRLMSGHYQHYQRQQIDDFCKRATSKLWPIVEFSNGHVRTISAHCMIQELGATKPYSLLSRTQIPLLPGWALTIHKSQGMTIDRLMVDLEQVFEKGQAYVALSRARDLSGLVVHSLPMGRGSGANQQVKAFYERLFGSDVDMEDEEE